MMEKYKGDIKTIIEVLAFVLVCMLWSTVYSIPVISWLLIGLGVVFWLWNLYTKIHYRMGRANYILFKTQNDTHYKITSLTLGLIVLIVSLGGLMWMEPLNNDPLIGLMLGVLVFLNGLFDLPKGKLVMDGNTISLSGLKNALEIEQLKEIIISEERILLITKEDKTLHVEYLEISPESAQQIEGYIYRNKNNHCFTILNSLNHTEPAEAPLTPNH